MTAPPFASYHDGLIRTAAEPTPAARRGPAAGTAAAAAQTATLQQALTTGTRKAFTALLSNDVRRCGGWHG